MKVYIKITMAKKIHWDEITGITKKWFIDIGRFEDTQKICIANIGSLIKGKIEWSIVAYRADNKHKIIIKGKEKFNLKNKLIDNSKSQLSFIYPNHKSNYGT